MSDPSEYGPGLYEDQDGERYERTRDGRWVPLPGSAIQPYLPCVRIGNLPRLVCAGSREHDRDGCRCDGSCCTPLCTASFEDVADDARYMTEEADPVSSGCAQSPQAGRPLACKECGIEQGWPCAYLDPIYDGLHGDRKAKVCALAQAHAKGLVVGLVPKETDRD